MSAPPDYDRVASVLVAVALRLLRQEERSEPCGQQDGEDSC